MDFSFSLYDCSIIQFKKIKNRAGNITSIENNVDIPFSVKRIYYLYDVPSGETRGGHAHRDLEQVVFAVSGSFDITIDDGRTKKTVQLNRPDFGLYLPPGIWRDISNFSSGAVCLVLASDKFQEADYIRDYNNFLSARSFGKKE
jgi:glyoxylate utilization-related uncharacterized protein